MQITIFTIFQSLLHVKHSDFSTDRKTDENEFSYRKNLSFSYINISLSRASCLTEIEFLQSTNERKKFYSNTQNKIRMKWEWNWIHNSGYPPYKNERIKYHIFKLFNLFYIKKSSSHASPWLFSCYSTIFFNSLLIIYAWHLRLTALQIFSTVFYYYPSDKAKHQLTKPKYFIPHKQCSKIWIKFCIVVVLNFLEISRDEL